MKSKYLLLLVLLSIWTINTQAQNYKWAIGGGSTSSLTSSADWEQVTYMCTDSNRNLYLTTTMGDDDITADTFFMPHAFNTTVGAATPRPHIFIASYAPNGKIRWGKLFDAQYLSRCYGIQSDGSGNIYIIGYLFGNNKHLGYDTVITSDNLTSFIVKYDTSGNFKWVRFIGADTKATRDAAAFQSTLAIDGNHFIHYYSLIARGVQITPSITSTTGTYDLKYDSLGNLIDVKKISVDSNENFYQVVFNKASGNSYANIMSIEPSTGNAKGAYIEAFDSIDKQIWVDSAAFMSAEIADIVYDGLGNIYGIGDGNLEPFYIGRDTAKSSNESTNVCAIFKLDTLGKVKWLKSFEGDAFLSVNGLLKMCITPNGYIATTGLIAGAAILGRDSIVASNDEGWNPIFVVVDSNGKLMKLDQLHGDAFYEWGTSITSDRLGNIYIGGMVGDSIYASDIKSYHKTGGETDFFVVKYGYNDGCTLATEPTPMYTMSGDSTHVPTTMSFTYTGANTPDSVHWAFGDGDISRTLNPSHTYTDTGNIQVCLTVYGCDSGTYCSWVRTLPPTFVSNVKAFPALEVYPNPVVEQLNVNHLNAGTTVQMFDLIGSKIYSAVASNDHLVIDARSMQPGIYLLVLTNKEGQKESMRIVKAE